MKTLGNILWHIPFLGFLSAFLTGIIAILSIVGIPIGLGLIQFSKFLLAPFSRAMIDKKHLNKTHGTLWHIFATVVRILYFPAGLLLAVVVIFQIAGLFISIIGIPVAFVLAYSLGTYFNPINKICVPKVVAIEIQERLDKQQKTVELTLTILFISDNFHFFDEI